MIDYIRQNKAFLPIVAVIAVVLVALIWLLGIRTPGYAVYINGNNEFAIKNKADLAEAVNEIERVKEKTCSQELELATPVECKRGFVSRAELLSPAEVQRKLAAVLEFKVSGAAIMVDGKAVAYVESKASANRLLERLKREYAQPEAGEKVVDVSFAEKVSVKEEEIPIKRLMPEDKAFELICTGTNNPEKYIVKEGDNLWLIARRNDMYVADIVKANRLTTDNLQLEQELILVKSKPYINVVTQVEGEKIEQIPFQTEVLVDKHSPRSIRVKTEGRNGEKHIVYKASKRNGLIEKTDIIEEKILKPAVNKVIVKGTQVIKVASRGGGGSGSLDWPVYGPITQYFKGRAHTGIDIGAKTGQAIRAADSGYVSYVGYRGGYGKFVIINHGNGVVTRYAHCSSINVSTGQKVGKGETIAAVGSTGRSTGPHLHFEVLVNGSFTNPLKSLR